MTRTHATRGIRLFAADHHLVGSLAKRRKPFGTVPAVLAMLLLGACRGDSARGPGETVRVERRVLVSTVTAVGAIKPRIGAEVRVGSRISGRVRRLRANIGDRVTKGQIVAELETEELDAIIAQRRAELRLASAKLSALPRLSASEIAQAQSEITRFAATARLAAEELQRQQDLLRARVSSRVEADAAQERSAVAHAQLESSRGALDLLRTRYSEERTQAEAEAERAQAALRGAIVDRSFAVIHSPIAGIVASVATQEGETVAAGITAPTFVTIIDLGRLQVHAYVDEVDIGKIGVGQRAMFTVDAFPARDFEGRIAAVFPSATIQDNVVKYVVAIDIMVNAGEMLRPDMTANVRVDLVGRSVLALPSRAIRRAAGRSVVYVADGARSVARPVRLGWRDGPWAEVVAGVREGERVLLDPPTPAQNGNR